MRIKPRLDQVLIKLVEETSNSSIILLNSAKKDPMQIGEVIEVGPGKRPNTIEIYKGNKVILPKYAGIEVKEGKNRYLLVSYNDILARI